MSCLLFVVCFLCCFVLLLVVCFIVYGQRSVFRNKNLRESSQNKTSRFSTKKTIVVMPCLNDLYLIPLSIFTSPIKRTLDSLNPHSRS